MLVSIAHHLNNANLPNTPSINDSLIKGMSTPSHILTWAINSLYIISNSSSCTKRLKISMDLLQLSLKQITKFIVHL